MANERIGLRSAATLAPMKRQVMGAVDVVACLALSATAVLLRVPVMGLGDFGSYSAAAHRAFAGEPVYTVAQLVGPYTLNSLFGGRGFVYPPTAVPMLAWATFGEPAGLAFMVLAFAALTYVTVTIVRRGLRSLPLAGWLVALLLLVSPFATDAIYAGQVTPLIAAGYGVAWLWPRAAPWMAVAGGGLKVFPSSLMVFALRKGVPIAPALASGAALVLATTLWLGLGAWTDFVRAWANARPLCGTPSLGSLTCAFGPAGAAAGLAAAVGIVVLSLFVKSDALSMFAIGVASVIAAPDLYPNYGLILAVAALPMLCAAWRRLVEGRRFEPVGRAN